MIPKDLILGDWIINDQGTYALFKYYRAEYAVVVIVSHSVIDNNMIYNYEIWRRVTQIEKKCIRSKLKNALKKQTESEYQSHGR